MVKDAPKWSQYGPKIGEHGPRWSQDVLKMASDSPGQAKHWLQQQPQQQAAATGPLKNVFKASFLLISENRFDAPKWVRNLICSSTMLCEFLGPALIDFRVYSGVPIRAFSKLFFIQAANSKFDFVLRLQDFVVLGFFRRAP